MTLAPADLRALADARALLERPSLAARLSDFVGSPLEKGMARLPAGWRARIATVTHDALGRAMDAAAKTLDETPRAPSPRLHKALGTLSGGVGGAFGLAGLTVE
ncbi:MAG: EcsC family protein, partial [Thauera sp.]|nr:EcsC family protein [Thauera sp.]